MKHMLSISVLLAALLPLNGALAGEAEDMAAMQRQLNAEVMAQEFDPGDQAKVDAYIKEAMEKGLKPKKDAPDFWRPGYTCRDARRYSYAAYRDCRYHYRYYGYYW